MGIIDIKLKSYEELQFEITRLNTDKYLLEQKNKDLQDRIDSAICYLEEHQEIIAMIGTNYYKLLDKLKGK